MMMYLNQKMFRGVTALNSVTTALATISFSLCLTGCRDHSVEAPDQLQEVEFCISQRLSGPSGGRMTSTAGLNEMTRAIITIIRKDGNTTDFTNTPIDMFVMAGRVFTEKISLEGGSYQLQALCLASSSNQTLFATPLNSSALSTNVSTPLPIHFDVAPEIENVISLEVISVQEQDPSDFGVEFFEVGVVETIDFQISVSELGTTNFIPSSLTINYGSEPEYTSALIDPITPVKVRVQGDYAIQITANGYAAYSDVLTHEELKAYETDERIYRIELTPTQTINTFSKLYGGSGHDYGHSVRQTSDGGYIVAGSTRSSDGDIEQMNGIEDFWLLKLNAQGHLEWEQTYGGSSSDQAESVAQTTDGGYIVAGHTLSSDGDVGENQGQEDIWVLKLDAHGHLEWEQTYGGSSTDIAYSIQQISNGGYIVAGHTESSNGDVTENKGSDDFWVLNLDAQGHLIWERTYGGSSLDRARSIQQVFNGGYILTGETQSSDGDVTENKGSSDIWVLNLDAQGDLIWEQTYGGSGSDIPEDIQQTQDGGVAISGLSKNQGQNNYDLSVLKLDSQGSLIWEQHYGGSGTEMGYSLDQTSDGGYIITATTFTGWNTLLPDGDVNESKGWGDIWLVKLNAHGSLAWEKSFGGSSAEYAISVHQTTDKGYILAGHSASTDGDLSERTAESGQHDLWVLKLDEHGNL